MKTRITRGAGIVLLSALALAGCSAVEAEFGSGEQSEAPEQSEQSEQSEAPEEQGFTNERTNDLQIYESQVQLSDGRFVTCLKYDEGYGGGMSCDWDNATAPDAPSASDGGE